ncbi:polyprenyl synthetase family protein [Selenomonas sputigena]|uniref:Farnesyl diphosphate synthase n=1 Tax=Selenomonas sputigena (strain ATCC 35185 / DSM 20758 / CCUG 44933 / VPI D19B-28) TaxID=546271 RepID=C9LUP0_SELS3|nr:farnesyl diphosphate synthase [Selenomonas sputigena]AEC00031.1 Polyprenyl synthetase [Selenomonas sputigena ATCC 35185]EEX77473.1 polyprenyl synthetase [Selenomonas sputigena ATCC 35185]
MHVNFKAEWKKRADLVEEGLLRELKKVPAYDETLEKAMEYSLMAGGKRLRPVLLMAAADAVGKDGAAFLTTGCAIEMIHTYSLIHDDLPAMDNDDYRRGKPTNHKVFGDGIAVLAGDALLTLAFEVMLRQEGAAPETLVTVVSEMSRAAGPYGMVGGQVLDLEGEGRRLDLAALRKIHMGKTGALFCAAIRSGAILAGAKEEELAALTLYAERFGLAFQITDDILDVTGDEAAIGKPVGSDVRNEKATYVTLTSLEEAKKLAEDAVDEAVVALDIFGERAAFLRDLALFLLGRKK